MVIILIAAAVISGIVREFADAVVILAVVILNSVLGVVQEGKAEKAIEALAKLSSPFSKVRRNGHIMQIKSEELVPGDIVLLEAGDAVPADMRLIRASCLKIGSFAYRRICAVEKIRRPWHRKPGTYRWATGAIWLIWERMWSTAARAL